MHYLDYAKQLLLSENLEDKLVPLRDVEYDLTNIDFKIPNYPSRSKKIEIKKEQAKFPKKTSFHLDEKRAMAIHFFANHELLAIEMMATALLYYPVHNEQDILFKKGLVKTIQDEQKHLKLYLNRMKDFGLELGDLPLNDFFWRQIHELNTPSKFYATMALVFESANLDFAKYYEECFKEVEDFKSSEIMHIVFEDEKSHVALGAHWLNIWRKDKSLWEYFNQNLPMLMTPARAKGIHFNRQSRVDSGLDIDFVDKLEKYYDDFGITNRKNW